jgi:Flp pilus assembly protein TadB
MGEYRVARSIAWFWIAGAGGCLAIAIVRIIPGPELKVLQAALIMAALSLLLGWRSTFALRRSKARQQSFFLGHRT